MLNNARLLLLQKNQLYIPPTTLTHTHTFQNEYKHFNFVQSS